MRVCLNSVPGLGSQGICVMNRIGLPQELEPFSFVPLWMPGQGEGLRMLAPPWSPFMLFRSKLVSVFLFPERPQS